MMQFQIQHQRIEPVGRELFAEGQIGFVDICFCFSDDWEYLDKVAQFSQKDAVYQMHLGTGTVCTCTLPSELEKGEAELSVFGYTSSEAQVIRGTTAPIKLFLHRSGFSEDGTESVPPTPDLYAQLLEQIDAKIASVKDGEDGFSPSATVEQTETGATITITDKDGTTTAEIRNGEKGDTGETGANGTDGQDGKSAYEIAVESGYTGTETEWLASLKGEKGDTGETGAAGADGADGADGKSAYEIWLAAGNAGTEAEFLESLKGEKGDTGAQGEQGLQGETGAAGADGQDGKSAYEIAVENGYAGTESEWLESLKGEKGDTGETGAQGEKGDTGEKGETGETGSDGYSPTASVTKADGVATITITDKEGTTTATVSDGETPDISDVENTVEALAAGLSDSGWVQLEESAFTSGDNIDTENSAVYYRKIGSTVNLCGKIMLTATPATNMLLTLPSAIIPHADIMIAAEDGSGNFIPCVANSYGYFTCGISTSTTYPLTFNTTYMTDDAPADVSSLLAALADLVEVSE